MPWIRDVLPDIMPSGSLVHGYHEQFRQREPVQVPFLNADYPVAVTGCADAVLALNADQVLAIREGDRDPILPEKRCCTADEDWLD